MSESLPTYPPNRSATIGKLAAALCAAQAKIKNAVKDAANPFFKSKYADLASVREACMSQLTEAGIAVMQLPSGLANGIQVETLFMHTSGEWISSFLFIPCKADAQSFGSAITYARRYMLASMAGVASEDDDGNAAAAKPHLYKADAPISTADACFDAVGEAKWDAFILTAENTLNKPGKDFTPQDWGTVMASIKLQNAATGPVKLPAKPYKAPPAKKEPELAPVITDQEIPF